MLLQKIYNFMKNYAIKIFLGIVVLTVLFFLFARKQQPKNVFVSSPQPSRQEEKIIIEKLQLVSKPFFAPLDRCGDRVSKKPFGIFITPDTSPVQPERFGGFHTGTDFEIFATQKDERVFVEAVCDGRVVYEGFVAGYGGVLVEECVFDDETVTVLYGHLAAPDILFHKDDKVITGAKIGGLGNDRTSETDGERKHLHLSVKKGTHIDFRGYVTTEEELKKWIDPLSTLVCEQ